MQRIDQLLLPRLTERQAVEGQNLDHIIVLLADKYKGELQLTDDRKDVWKELFRVACQEKKDALFPCDLVPFWHTESKSDIKIERYVPLYPYSRDIEKYNNMIKILTFYRLILIMRPAPFAVLIFCVPKSTA